MHMVEATKDHRLLKAETVISTQEHTISYLDVKWTYEEYKEELKKPIEPPAQDDPEDPGYYKKYAQNIPPLVLYFVIPDRHQTVARDEVTKDDRRVFFGWNNVTDFERAGVKAL